METVIVTTESAIEKIMERVLDKKLPKPPESDVEKTYSINQVARMMGRFRFEPGKIGRAHV